MGGISVLFLMGILSTIFLFFVFIFISMVFVYIIGYLFEGLTVSSYLTEKRYQAWIPFYNKYLLGNITGEHQLGIVSAICSVPGIIMGYVLFMIGELNYVLFGIFLLILIVGFIVDHIIAYHYISQRSRYANVLIVISVLTLGILRPIMLFILKDRR